MIGEQPSPVKAAILKRIDMGFAAQQVMDSEAMQHIAGEAERQRHDLVEELLAVPPDDVARNYAVRLEIAKIDTWQFWLTGLVTEGHNAQQELQALEAESSES